MLASHQKMHIVHEKRRDDVAPRSRTKMLDDSARKSNDIATQAVSGYGFEARVCANLTEIA